MTNTSFTTQDKEKQQSEGVLEKTESTDEKDENNNLNALQATKETINQAKDKALEFTNQAKEKALNVANEAKEKALNIANEAKEKALDVANEAKDKALEFANQAKEKAKEKLQVLGKDLYKTVKEILKEGKARTITIRNEKGEKVFSISSIVGIAATLFLGRALAPLAVAAGWLTKYTIEFEKIEESEDSKQK